MTTFTITCTAHPCLHTRQCSINQYVLVYTYLSFFFSLFSFFFTYWDIISTYLAIITWKSYVSSRKAHDGVSCILAYVPSNYLGHLLVFLFSYHGWQLPMVNCNWSPTHNHYPCRCRSRALPCNCSGYHALFDFRHYNLGAHVYHYTYTVTRSFLNSTQIRNNKSEFRA